MKEVLILLSIQETYYTDFVPVHGGSQTLPGDFICGTGM